MLRREFLSFRFVWSFPRRDCISGVCRLDSALERLSTGCEVQRSGSAGTPLDFSSSARRDADYTLEEGGRSRGRRTRHAVTALACLVLASCLFLAWEIVVLPRIVLVCVVKLK